MQTNVYRYFDIGKNYSAQFQTLALIYYINKDNPYNQLVYIYG